jgi:CDP-glucose 4,6-dehydratase
MEKLDMNAAIVDLNFWAEKKVFITGHTGFKGSWLSLWLLKMGAKVAGFSNKNENSSHILSLLNPSDIQSFVGDIRDLNALLKAINAIKPDVVIHMAAQSLVRDSYRDPIETYSTNLMGTINLLEALRYVDTVGATIIVTTDKCYENKEWIWGYRESDPLGGSDPYSSSKACAELITNAYRASFFGSPEQGSINSIATARAGNVVGGGDFSTDRLVPDIYRSATSQTTLQIRSPGAIRPWQHVLEPLSGYLVLAQNLHTGIGQSYAESWNFGPSLNNTVTVEEIIRLFEKNWGSKINWEKIGNQSMYESSILKVDSTKAMNKLGWHPKWNIEETFFRTVEWYKAFFTSQNALNLSLHQINEYMRIGE